MNRACFTNANLHENNHMRAASDLFKTNYFRMKTIVLIFMISILTITLCNSQQNVKLTENIQFNGSVSEYEILVLDGVTIIDGTGAPLKSSMSITIENGKITAINKQGEADYPPMRQF
jgi:predicted transglutaminase-like protease